MSCLSISASYSDSVHKNLPKQTSFANSIFPSLDRKGKVITKNTQKCQKSCIDFPKLLCHRCLGLFEFRTDGFTVPCICKFKGEICVTCKELDLVKTILDFAGETGVLNCNSGYASADTQVHKIKTPLHEFLSNILRCDVNDLAGKLHLKENYGTACRALKRLKLTCKYLDDDYLLAFERFTFKGAEKERLSSDVSKTVAQYLRENRGLVLEHPGLPCIVVRGRVQYKFPLECVLAKTESEQ